jgi:hypothetical protein
MKPMVLLRPVVHVRRIIRSPKMVSRHVVLAIAPQLLTTFVVDRDPVTPPEVMHVLQDTLVSSIIGAVVMSIK